MPKEKESFSDFASRIEAQYSGVFRNVGFSSFVLFLGPYIKKKIAKQNVKETGKFPEVRT